MADFGTGQYPHGLLARALTWIRVYANQPAESARYSDNDLSLLLAEAFDQVIVDLYGLSDCVPLARYNFTVVAGQQAYKLPADVQEVHSIAKINTTTGLADWEIVPDSRRAYWGPNILFEGIQDIRLIPTPTTSGDVVTVTYVPGGPMLMHQGVTNLFGSMNDEGAARATKDSIKLLPALQSTHSLGTYDRRPNAYLGRRIRLLGTINGIVPPGAGLGFLPWFPTQERIITAYNIHGGPYVEVEPAFDPNALRGTGLDWEAYRTLDMVNLGVGLYTYMVYEIVPDVDPAVFWLATIQAAINVVTIGKQTEMLKILMDLYDRKKRTAQMRLANFQLRRPEGMGDINTDVDGDW